MKVVNKILFGLVSLIFFTSSSCYGEASTNFSQLYPRVSIDAPDYDFGVVDQGTLVFKTFRLENKGEGDLLIKEIDPDCGCTTTIASSDVAKGGESLSFDMSFDTSHFSGKKLKKIRVHTNDPINPIITLQVSGIIVPEVAVSPTRVYFSEVVYGLEQKKEVDVILSDNSNVEIIEIVSKSNYIKLKQSKLTDNRGVKLSIRLSKDTPIGVLKSRILIRNTSKNNPIIVIPVFANILGELRYKPKDLAFGLYGSSEDEEKRKVITLENHQDRAFIIDEILTSDDNIKIIQKNNKNSSNKHELYVSLKTNEEGIAKTIKGLVEVKVIYEDDGSTENATFSVFAILD